jgi:CelD/BcsL family acetyltransferase involved in cellulose biosynthesis
MLSLKQITFEDNIDWNGLINQSTTATFFQTKEWLSLWVKHFDGETVILGVFDNDELIGISPFLLSKDSIQFLGTSAVLGKELVSDFGDIIAKTSCEKAICQEILANLKSKFPNSKIQLDFIREESPTFQILKELGGKEERIEVSPYIHLPKTWDEYLLLLDRHDRHELRRKMRKLESENAFKTCFSEDKKEIDEFFRLMALSNEQKRDFLSHEMVAFMRDVITTLYKRNELAMCFLKKDDIYIAAAIVFLFNNQVLLYNSGFDPQYSYLSPGLILKSYMIRQAIEDGKSRFDFLRGAERYKYDLGAKERKLYKITL